MGVVRGFARVRREALSACLTCPLCRGLLREATAITQCLHTCEFPLLSLPRDPGCLSHSLSRSFVRALYLSPVSARAGGGRHGFPAPPPRGPCRLAVCVLRFFLCVSDSSCSLVQMTPAIGLVSHASSSIPGGWRTRRLSRGLWSRALRVCRFARGGHLAPRSRWCPRGRRCCRSSAGVGFGAPRPRDGSSHVAVHPSVFSAFS